MLFTRIVGAGVAAVGYQMPNPPVSSLVGPFVTQGFKGLLSKPLSARNAPKRGETRRHAHPLPCAACSQIDRVDRGWGGLMMVGVAPPMATNPPDGVMALPAGGLHTKAAPRASPATHGAPKAPIGTHPTPRGPRERPFGHGQGGCGAQPLRKPLKPCVTNRPKGPETGGLGIWRHTTWPPRGVFSRKKQLERPYYACFPEDASMQLTSMQARGERRKLCYKYVRHVINTAMGTCYKCHTR